jgi:hypothetical protein
MPYRTLSDQIDFLRDQADRFRRMARDHQTLLSPTLVEMATELEMQADRLAKNLYWGKPRLTERPHEIIYDRLRPDRRV